MKWVTRGSRTELKWVTRHPLRAFSPEPCVSCARCVVAHISKPHHTSDDAIDIFYAKECVADVVRAFASRGEKRSEEEIRSEKRREAGRRRGTRREHARMGEAKR